MKPMFPIFWLILLIEIWTFAAAAGPSPNISAARMMAANHLKRTMVPSRFAPNTAADRHGHPIYRRDNSMSGV